MKTAAMKRYCLFIACVFVVSGCAGVRHAVPLNLSEQVTVSGLQDIRAISGKPSFSFERDFMKLLEEEERQNLHSSSPEVSRVYSVLAISGGAANGAYGAGLLNGWSQEGSRPKFIIVTGISVGAIIAPFAFLGSSYDSQLKEFCTHSTTRNILKIRLSHNSLASSVPLERLIEKYFDEKLLTEIAQEYKKGRRLYVGTTNLDTQRLVIWDMGKIASCGGLKALKLFRKIILASSSIPVAFPPVYLNVETNGQTFDEMHVDGGVIKQVFFLFDIFRGFNKAMKTRGVDLSKIKYKIYIIRNGYVDAIWKQVPDRLSSIAERTVDTTTNSQTVGDIYQLYVFSRLHHGDFNLAYIPGDHCSKARELFDSAEMRKLFDLGFNEASHGYRWKKTPPGLEEYGMD